MQKAFCKAGADYKQNIQNQIYEQLLQNIILKSNYQFLDFFNLPLDYINFRNLGKIRENEKDIAVISSKPNDIESQID